MTQALMQNFNKYVMPATIESLQQRIALFNAASAGTIVLSTAGFNGDFSQESFWAGIHSAQRRVDRYAANGTAPVTDLTQKKRSKVKVAGGFGPVLFEPAQLSWLMKPTSEGIEVISRNLAEALLADQLNTAIAALCAAIGAQAALVNDVSATLGLSQVALNDTHAKFGDQSQRLIAEIMTGAAYHNLVGKNLANAQTLFTAGNVRVVDILGKPSIITDAPALYVAGTPNKYKVLSLAAGAAEVIDGGDMISNIAVTNGKERIESTMQVDYTFGVGLLGYTWDEANGGKSPTDAELATGTNWDLIATSIKQTAGVMTIGDAAK